VKKQMRALWVLFLAGCAGAQQYVISTVAGGAPPATPMVASSASIGDPARVAVDRAGNVYFTSLHSVFRVDPGGTLTRFAGNGRPGNSGDGGPASSAQLNGPMGMAIDSAGNVYVADRDANVVRRISPAGVISTVATDLSGPFAVAVDGAGTLYIADTGSNRVVKRGPDGTQVEIAGSGALNRPEGVAVDASGSVYIADTFNGQIKRIADDGSLVTVAGTGSTGVFGGDNNPAESAALSLPTDITFDAQGNLYIADFGNGRIRRIANGIISSVAGASNGAPVVDGEPAASTSLEGPTGIAVDRNGTLYFAEGGIGSGSGLAKGDYRVWKVTDAGELATLAGNGEPSFSGDGGPAISSQLNGPSAIGFDAAGNFYIADTDNQRVRRVSADGTIATVIGNGTPGFAVDFGNPADALLHAPRGVAVDAAGRLYIADTLNNRVRKIEPGGNVSTYAGNGNASYFGDGGPAVKAALNQPEGIALDASGNLYIADMLDHVVRKVTPDGTITTIAGFGTPGFAGDGGQATQARLYLPQAVAVDGAGNVYVADTGNHRVRRIDPLGIITTIAGTGETGFAAGDGPAASTALSSPRGVAADAAGNVYIADTGHNRIRKVFPSGAITTIAGQDGTCCYSGDGGVATAAQLNQPAGLWLDGAGNLYVADTGNNAIRVLHPIATSVAISAVTNAASNAVGPVAPGELVTIYGSGLDAVTSVQFNGVSATPLYSTTNQTGVAVPYGITGANVQVSVQTANAASAPFTAAVAAVAPGVFTADGSGRGQAAALNQDGSPNRTGSPAAAGQVLTLFVTGEGQTTGSPPHPVAPVTVTIGGAQAQVQYAGATAAATAGVMQVNVVVPDRAFGTVPVVVSVGGVATQDGVTVVVR
jgi:trimeric autotransporter adhesin